ncbi:MAG TPA: multiple monosaccharide ABC transporter permease [Propionicimonas sp.]
MSASTTFAPSPTGTPSSGLDGTGDSPTARRGRRLPPNLRQNGISVAFVAIVGIIAILTHGVSLGPENLTNLVLQYSYIFILAIGMLVVIVSGHIDLSVGSVLGLAGAVSAILVIREGQPWWVGALAGIAVGTLAGAWHGFWVAVVRIPAWVTTLAGMLLFRGLTLLVLGNTSLSPFGKPYTEIATGFQRGLIPGGSFDIFTCAVFAVAVVAYAVSQWRTRRSAVEYQQPVERLPLFVAKVLAVGVVAMWFGWQLAHARGLPNILIILAVVFLAYGAIMTSSVFGRNVYAIGGNVAAARLSGVKVRKVDFWIMTNMGMLSGLAGIAFSSRVNSAVPMAGNSFEMDAIAACFIGGAASTGGSGTVGGAMVGGLVMAVLSNGMQLLGVDQSMQQVVKGAVLMLAVAFDIYGRKRSATAG